MIANYLTLGRIALALPFAALFLTDPQALPWARSAALGVLLLAAITDYADGAVARALDQTSALGAALDPIADKVLVAAGFIALATAGLLSLGASLAAILILSREFLICGLRESVSARGGSIPVTKLAKWKTTLQLIAVISLVAIAPGGALANFGGQAYAPIAYGFLWTAAALTVWSGASYAIAAAHFLRTRPPSAPAQRQKTR